MKIAAAAILVKTDKGTVHEVVLSQKTIIGFLERQSFVKGQLEVSAELKGIDIKPINYTSHEKKN